MDSLAIFGWCDNEKRLFTQMVNDGKMGNELMNAKWEDNWPFMARFDVGGVQYIMGLQVDGRYFIQELMPTGDLGRVSGSGFLPESGCLFGLWGFTVPDSVSGNRTFVIDSRFDYDANSGSWAIWGINKDGSLGPQTDHGTFDEPFVLLTIAFSNDTYLYGEGNNTGYTFLKRINPDGTLGPETDHCTQYGWYWVPQALRKNGHTYLFGEDTVSKFWFLQEIYETGAFGPETDSGHWNDAYESTASWETDDGTYLFCQSRENDHRWFITDIYDGGKMNPGHTSYGYWNNFYNYVFPFKFSSAYLDVEHWMTDLYDDYLKDRKLSQICLPGSPRLGNAQAPALQPWERLQHSRAEEGYLRPASGRGPVFRSETSV